MGKHTAREDLQRKADEFDDQYDISAANAAENTPTADERIAALKAANSEHFRLHRGRR
jgi:hypothetical protein